MKTPPKDKLEQWLIEYIAEAEALQERLGEHLITLERLEQGERLAQVSDTDEDDSIASESFEEAHKELMGTLDALVTITQPEPWCDEARDVIDGITGWLREKPTGDIRKVNEMQARVAPLRDGVKLIEALVALEEEIAEQMSHINEQHSGENPKDALARLVETESDLKTLSGRLTEARGGILRQARAVGDPQIFAGILGQTSGLKSDIQDNIKALRTAETTLQKRIEDDLLRDEIEQLSDDIRSGLGSLPTKGDPTAWRTLRDEVVAEIGQWRKKNRKLNTRLDSAAMKSAYAVLTDSLGDIDRIAPAQAALDAAEKTLKALPKTTTDVARAATITAEAQSVVDDISEVQAGLIGLSGPYNGPAIFQGLLNQISSLQSAAHSLVFSCERAEALARRNARDDADEAQLLDELEERLEAVKRSRLKTLNATADFTTVGELLTPLETELKGWRDDSDDVDGTVPGAAAVARALQLINRAQSVLPRLISDKAAFERRRSVEFAQVSQELLDLLEFHAILERLHHRLAPDADSLSNIADNVASLGADWAMFAAVAAAGQALSKDLEDFADRLYRMSYGAEGQDVDDKTTSQGGKLNLTPEEETAAKQFYDARVETHLKEENTKRAAQGEEPLRESDVDPFILDQFMRIARRMIKQRTEKHSPS